MGPLGYPELVVLCLLGLVLLSIGFWIWMLIDCIVNEPAEDSSKITWVVVIALLGALGGLVYLFARRSERKKLYGR